MPTVVLARETTPMAPTKRKATNQNTSELKASNLHNIPVQQVTVPTEQTLAHPTEAEKHAQAQRAQQEKNKAALVNPDPEGTEDDEPPLPQQDEYTQTTLKIKALERHKAILNAQLATKQRAMYQAKKLAEAKRKLAKMQV